MRAAVLGSPIAHSLSPVLHRAAYAHLRLDWTYDAIECDQAGLADFVRGLGPQWAGLSLTMPLKTAVLPLLDEADQDTAAAGAANTLLLRDGRRVGANTDVAGLVAVLGQVTQSAPGPHGDRADGTTPVVLGGGATARSALVALAATGQRTAQVIVRRPQACAQLLEVADRVGLHLQVTGWPAGPWTPQSSLLVATVPAGASDELADQLTGSTRGATVVDVVYQPWPTKLGAAWAAHGGSTVGGLELLLHQGAVQVQLMTGCRTAADELVAAMRPAALTALTAHTGSGEHG